MPEGCHYIEVTFLSDTPSLTFGDRLSGFFLFLAGGAFAFFWLRWWKPKPATNAQEKPAETDTHWLHFGQCRLDTTRQILICKSQTQPLTFREAKLLRLFASHPDQLLEREHIIQQVWADEGVLVGRSVDMFVSRLRKKLASDPSVGIAAVHGVGYRLETGRTPDVASNEPLSK